MVVSGYGAAVSDDPERDEYEGGTAAPPEGEQQDSHESTETLSPDETGDEPSPPFNSN
jgi:hypothetical protein